MPYIIQLTPQAEDDLAALPLSRRQMAEQAMDHLAVDPDDPLLQSHRNESVFGPDREEIWDSYAEDGKPDGLRMWWWFGPGETDITVHAFGPHPD